MSWDSKAHCGFSARVLVALCAVSTVPVRAAPAPGSRPETVAHTSRPATGLRNQDVLATIAAPLRGVRTAASPKARVVQTVDANPLQMDVVLRGGNGSTSFTLQLAQGESQSTTLVVDWSLSSYVDAASSALTVELDRAPVATVPLRGPAVVRSSQGDGRTSVKVALGVVSEGFHVVTLRARLNVLDDPCLLRHQDDAWMRIHHTTRIVMPRAPRPAMSLANFPQQFQNAVRNQSHVLLKPPTSADAASAGATLDADASLRTLGVQPEISTLSTDARVPRLILGVIDSPADNARTAPTLRLALESALLDAATSEKGPSNSDAIGGFAVVGDDVHVLSRDSSVLAQVVVQLMDPVLRAACAATAPCLVHSLAPREIDVKKNQQAPNETKVWELGDVGYAEGFTAAGPGTHTLRFVWMRPPAWIIEDAPELTLHIATPLLDTERVFASAVVTLNDRPLASWDLSNAAAGDADLKVKVPLEQAAVAAWSFEVRVNLRPKDQRSCDAADTDNLWAVLRPISRLEVERTQPHHAGVAGFFERHSSRRPALRWQQPPTWTTVARVAAVVAGFAQQTPRQTWWTATSATTPVERIEAAVDEVVIAESADLSSGDAALPLADAALSATLVLSTSKSSLTVGVGVDATVDPPNMMLVEEAAAVWMNGAWRGVGEPEAAPRVTVRNASIAIAPITSARTQSVDERRVRNVNALALGAVLLASGSLALVMIFRRPHPRKTGGTSLELPYRKAPK